MSNLITKTVGLECSQTVNITKKNVFHSPLSQLPFVPLFYFSTLLLFLHSSVRNKMDGSRTGENITGQKDDHQEQKREQEKHGKAVT